MGQFQGFPKPLSYLLPKLKELPFRLRCFISPWNTLHLHNCASNVGGFMSEEINILVLQSSFQYLDCLIPKLHQASSVVVTLITLLCLM